jgi:hypothetical protein
MVHDESTYVRYGSRDGLGVGISPFPIYFIIH